MKKSIIILWVATILSIVFFSLTQRYEIISTSTTGLPTGYKLDKLTGKVWALIGNKIRNLTDEKKK